MTSQAVALIRRSVDVFESEGFEAWLTQFVAEDAVFIQHSSVDVIDAPGTYRGRDGWRQALADSTAAFDDFEFLTQEVRNAGGGDVLLAWSQRGRGTGSGAVVEGHSQAFIHTVSQGKIVRTVQYGSVQEAVTAAGLDR